MPTTPYGRPPGRRDGVRPPEGRHVPAPGSSKHAALLNETLPAARSEVAAALQAGAPGLDSVQAVLDYAEEQAQRQSAQQSVRSATGENHNLRVPVEFAEHVRRQAAADKEKYPDSLSPNRHVRDSLEDFVNGDWMPARPERDRRGSNIAKTGLNVRVPEDLWEAANYLGKDPAAVESRGYKLTANSVAIAALMETYGQPGSTT